MIDKWYALQLAKDIFHEASAQLEASNEVEGPGGIQAKLSRVVGALRAVRTTRELSIIVQRATRHFNSTHLPLGPHRVQC